MPDINPSLMTPEVGESILDFQRRVTDAMGNLDNVYVGHLNLVRESQEASLILERKAEIDKLWADLERKGF